MLTTTPRSAGPERFPEKRLSISIPENPNDSHHDQTKQLGQSLNQKWEEASVRFKNVTKVDLGNFKSTKDGILGTLNRQYGTDSKEAKKRDDMWGTVETALNGVELIAQTTSQIASLVFSPAQMCFNAFEALLSIPRAIKKYGEDMRDLFKEISSYLGMFKIFERMERRGMLDVALIESNSSILVALIDICILAWKVTNHSVATVFGNAFLKNNDIRGALNGFRDLVAKQTQLTNTITLETVLKDPSWSRQMLRRQSGLENLAKDSNAMIKTLVNERTENKNLKVDKDRIAKIDKDLDLTDIMVTGPLDELTPLRLSLLEDSTAPLMADETFKSWYGSTDMRRMLFIGGGTRSGKTSILSALIQQIEEERRDMHIQQRVDSKEARNRDERSIYLTYYSFSGAGKAQSRGQSNAPICAALKIMAAQLARQSTIYANVLITQLEDVRKSQNKLDKLWKALKLNTFRVSDESVLYMLFDGLDWLKSGLSDLGKAMKASTLKTTSTSETDTLKLRILFTGNTATNKNLGIGRLPMIDISEINRPLIKSYVEIQLQHLKIFQDSDADSTELRKRVLEVISENSIGSFGVADQKIKLLQDAIQEDADEEALIQDLESSTFNSLADEGIEILRELDNSKDLSSQQKSQLKELLIWLFYGKVYFTLVDLEAVLYLQRDKKSLEPLKKKIEEKFNEALEINGDEVYPRTPILEVMSITSIRKFPDTSRDKDTKVTINVSVDNADEDSLRQFITDFGDRIAGTRFNFSSRTTRKMRSELLFSDRTEADLTIITKLFRALNDDRVYRHVESLVEYAADYLPVHLEDFEARSMESSSPMELYQIGNELINFLRDPESIKTAWGELGFDESWLSESCIHSIKSILANPRLQEELDPIQRRWAIKVTSKDAGKVAFFQTMASAVAEKWLKDSEDKYRSNPCFEFIDRYLDLLPYDWSPDSEKTNDETTNLDMSNTKMIQRELVNDTNAKSSVGENNKISIEGVENTHPLQRSESNEPVPKKFNSDTSELNDDISQSIPPDSNQSVLSIESGKLQALEEKPQQRGDFSLSSTDIELVGTSILIAKCQTEANSRVPAAINLNDCIGIEAGRLKWQEQGNAFATAENFYLSKDGVILELLLPESRGYWQSINLDEQIANKNGKMCFLNNSENNRPIGETNGTVDGNKTLHPINVRIERAKDWAVNILGCTLDATAFIRLGITLLGEDDNEAIKYFNMANPSPDNHLKALGLAQAYQQKGDLLQSLKLLQEVNSIFKNRTSPPTEKIDTTSKIKADSHIDDPVIDLFTSLNSTARTQVKLKRDADAIETLEEALSCRPWASSCRCQLIQLLCQNNNHTRAQELFDIWEKDFEEIKAECPVDFFIRNVDSDEFFFTFGPTINASRGTSVYASIKKLFRDAVDKTDASQQDLESMKMLYAYGVVIACEGLPDSPTRACQCWLDAVDIGWELEYPDVGALLSSSKLVGMHYFNQALQLLNNTRVRNGPEANKIFEQLRDDITNFTAPHPQPHREGYQPTIYATDYLAVFAQMIDRPDDTKALLRKGMADALEILSDEDIYNDRIGLTRLFQLLLLCGDIEGAFSAWSLLDRPTTRKRLKTKSETLYDTDVEAAMVITTSGVPSKSDIHNVPKVDEADEESERMKYMRTGCAFCDKEMSSTNLDQDQWWCKYCSYTVFCTSCREKLLRNDRTEWVCDPNHDHLQVKHLNYTAEELTGTNVRVGWKFQKVEANDHSDSEEVDIRERERIGGDIVDLSEWVTRLKKEWNVEDTQTEGKVQL